MVTLTYNRPASGTVNLTVEKCGNKAYLVANGHKLIEVLPRENDPDSRFFIRRLKSVPESSGFRRLDDGRVAIMPKRRR